MCGQATRSTPRKHVVRITTHSCEKSTHDHTDRGDSQGVGQTAGHTQTATLDNQLPSRTSQPMTTSERYSDRPSWPPPSADRRFFLGRRVRSGRLLEGLMTSCEPRTARSQEPPTECRRQKPIHKTAPLVAEVDSG